MVMDIQGSLISENATVISALQALDVSARKVLFLVREGRLVAALTDGDIRRWILSNGSLETTVDKVANYNPKYIKEPDRPIAHAYMLQHHLGSVPVVNDDLEIVDIITIYDIDHKQVQKTQLNMPVVIMAGGLGTRLYPYTKILPKPLIPIGDIPITEHIMNRFSQFGCRDFYMVVNHKKNMIKAYFNEIAKDYTITYIDEDSPLGTGGGVGLLRSFIHSTFVLTNCDTLIEEDLGEIVKQHKEKQNAITMICSLKNFSIPYGVVEIGENGAIAGMREKPQMSFFTNTGSYIVEPEIIDMIQPEEVIGFPDVIQRAKDSGRNVGVFPISEKAWMDMGQFDSMDEMRARLIESE